MDKQLASKMNVVVHSSQWLTFLEWLEHHEKTVIMPNLRKCPTSELEGPRSMLLFVEILRKLKDTVKRDFELSEDVE